MAQMSKEGLPDTSKVSSYLGFARRSGKVATGADLTLTAVRKAAKSGREYSVAILISKDASERTKKQISDKCTFYKVFFAECELDSYDLSALLGKKSPVTALAVTEENLAKAIINLYRDSTK